MTQPYIKIRKTDVANFPKLHEEFAKLSEKIKQSEHSFLYNPAPGNLRLFIDKLNGTNIHFSLISETQLYAE